MRIGRIKIEADLYENNYDSVKRIFEYLRPTMIEFDWARQRYEIFGICDLFEDYDGEHINDYTFSITVDEIKFDKI